MATGTRREAFGAYYFSVEIGGIKDAFFRSCSGLKSEAEVQELAEGGVNTTTHKLVGRTKYPNIVLKQGFSGHELFKLREKWLNDKPGQKLGVGAGRISGTITQMGPNGKMQKWTFIKGWICKWEGPDFDASKNEVSIESIEIAHEGLKTG
jgi:phage tail-like protein